MLYLKKEKWYAVATFERFPILFNVVSMKRFRDGFGNKISEMEWEPVHGQEHATSLTLSIRVDLEAGAGPVRVFNTLDYIGHISIDPHYWDSEGGWMRAVVPTDFNGKPSTTPIDPGNGLVWAISIRQKDDLGGNDDIIAFFPQIKLATEFAGMVEDVCFSN